MHRAWLMNGIVKRNLNNARIRYVRCRLATSNKNTSLVRMLIVRTNSIVFLPKPQNLTTLHLSDNYDRSPSICQFRLRYVFVMDMFEISEIIIVTPQIWNARPSVANAYGRFHRSGFTLPLYICVNTSECD